MAETHINHLQQFQGLLEAVKIVFGTGDGKSAPRGEVREIRTAAGLTDRLSSLGRG